MNDPLIPLLQSASLHALLILVSESLAKSGFYSVQFLGRREPSQKSDKGGHELLCHSLSAGYKQKVLVKVMRYPFRSRMFHELAGVAICERADFAILVAPHKLSSKMVEVQEACSSVRVEVIDGELLASRLRAQGTGIRASGEPDFAFFSALEEYSRKVLTFAKENKI